MTQRLILLGLVLTIACDGFVGEIKVGKRQPVEDVPGDAREVAPGTYVQTLKPGDGVSIEALPAFGYAETIHPQSPGDSVTSLEEGRRDAIPAGLRPVFAVARLGETRRVWSCPGRARSRCVVSEYTFYRQPQ